MKNVKLDELIFLALCISMGLIAKRIVSPITNILTDFIRIPGGGAATAFSLMFLVMGSAHCGWSFSGTACGFCQSLIALSLGMSSYQGIFALITYTAPGLVIDFVKRLYPGRDTAFFVIACTLANTVCALVTNTLVFHLQSLLFILWMLSAACSGMAAGLSGSMLYKRLSPLAVI